MKQGWIRLNSKGVFSNPHTGEILPQPDTFTVLKAIRGHAGSNPNPGFYVCLGEGKFVEIDKHSRRKSSLQILNTEQLCRQAWAVRNNGFAFFNLEAKLTLE